MIIELSKRIIKQEQALEQWFDRRFEGLTPPVYSSVDMRDAGYKFSVVDTNLFPAGFNNLCGMFQEKAADQFRHYWTSLPKKPQQVLIIPEAHTRNTYYWSHIHALLNILEQSGVKAWVGYSQDFGIELPETVLTQEGTQINCHLIKRKDDGFWVAGQRPDVCLVNNDFSDSLPESLLATEQVVIPSPQLGWFRRRKSDHFALYATLIREISEILDIDGWRLMPFMDSVTEIDLADDQGRQLLADRIDQLIARIAQKHQQYNIDSAPYVFVKDNSGTYGMAVMPVSSGKEILELNRRQRNKLLSKKGGGEVSQFLLQEGLPTVQSHETKPLEPVFYLVNGEVIGHFFRIHGERDERENLNVRGMEFDCLCSHKLSDTKDLSSFDCETPDQLRIVGGLLAKIASYAVSLELKQLDQ